MDPQTEDVDALPPICSPNCESPVPAYSPHTQGFPPTSHSSPSNPFSKKVSGGGGGGMTQVTGNSLPPLNPPTTPYFLRPSKLEAGLGSNIFAAKHTSAPNRIEAGEGKVEDEDVNRNTTTVNPPVAGDEGVAGHQEEKAEEAGEPVILATGETTMESGGAEESTTGTPPSTTDEAAGKNKVTSSSVNESETTNIPPTPGASDDPKNEYGGFNAPPVGFLFGSNLDDRVENVSRGVSNGDGHGGLVEGAAAGSSISPEGGKRKWEESSTVTTGEEHESNVMQVTSCRLFAFDVENSNWIERGRGMLRLNDRKEDDVLHSRLIVRTKGSLRVMLNTPVFPDMVVERSSEKCVKITGQEDGGGSSVKLFLIQCSPTDAETLHSALEWRVRAFPSPSAGDVAESGDGSESSPDSLTPPDCKVTIHQGHFESSTSPPKKPKLNE